MAKSFQRFLATLLALVMLLGVTGIEILAAEVAETPRGEEAVRVEMSAANRPRSTSGRTLAQLMAETEESEAQPDEADAAASMSANGETTYYNTLQEALDAAKKAGDATVDLLRDVVECVVIGYDPKVDPDGDTILDKWHQYYDAAQGGYLGYRDSKLILNLNGHTIDGGYGGQSFSGYDRPDNSTVTVHWNTTLTINGGGGKITGGYSLLGGGIMIGEVNHIRTRVECNPALVKDSVVTIRDVEVSGNYAWSEGSGLAGSGGGIYAKGGQPLEQDMEKLGGKPPRVDLTLDNVLITDNIGEDCGGGLGIFMSDVKVLNSEITNNQATDAGGGIEVYNFATCYVENSKINNNRSLNSGGGGIDGSSKSEVEIVDSEIKGNYSIYDGGGFAVGDTTAKVTGTEISGNETASGGGGIGIYTFSSLQLTDSKINDNKAGWGGGIEVYGYWSPVEVTATGCEIKGNSASGNGGGICCEVSGKMTLIDSDICDNTSGYGGGGIVAWKGDIALENCLVKGNYAKGDWGGGIAAWPGTVTMDKCVVVNNISDLAADDIYVVGDDSTLTATNMSFGDEVLTADGRPITGWYYDYADDYRWSETGYCVRTSKLSVGLPYKAAHGAYYGITYDLDGGTLGTDAEGNELTNPAEYEKGVSEFTLINPAKEGHTFLGWTGSNGDEAQTEVSITKKTSGDLSYTAHWEVIDYTVTYDLVGGETTSEATSFTQHYGDATATIADPTRTGYTFQGWSPAVTETVTGDATYTAQWGDIDYTVTYDLAGGETTSEATSFTQHYGDATATIAQPTRTGYTFQGWSPAVAETVTGDATYTAQWQAVEYKITYDLDDGALAEEESNPTVYTVESDTFTLKNPTKAGYTFLGWTGSNGDEAQTEVSVAQGSMGDLTYTAQWRRNSSGSRPSRPAPVEEIEDGDVPLADLPVVVPGLNHEDHVAYLIGRPDGTIAPLDNITRGEVATIFFRLLTEENRTANWSTTCSYTDMDGTEYFYNPVSTATKAGLIKGYDTGAFGGGDRITRAEMATIAARFLSEAYTGEDLFDDIGGHWAAEYINRAATAGWFKTVNADGTAVGSFRPNDYITRAEVVVMINRMLGRKASMEYLLPDMKTWPDNVYSESSAWYYLDIQEATNSHDYTQESAGTPEVWTGLRETPDWAAMERR